MKTIATLFLLLSAVVASAAPGSYSVLNFTLTGSYTDVTGPVATKGGVKYTATTAKQTITNASLVAQAVTANVIPAGSWQLVAVFSAQGEPVGLYAMNGATAVDVADVFTADFVTTATGSWVEDGAGKVVSGKLTGAGALLFSVDYNGDSYQVGMALTLKYAAKSGALVPAAWKSTVLTGGGDNGALVSGTISGGAGVPVADLSAKFPGL